MIYRANNLSEIYRISHKKHDVIRWYFKGYGSKIIAFQCMVLLQILTRIKFPFQRYKIWPALLVKKIHSYKLLTSSITWPKIVAPSKFRINILKKKAIPSYMLLTQFAALWKFFAITSFTNIPQFQTIL